MAERVDLQETEVPRPDTPKDELPKTSAELEILPEQYDEARRFGVCVGRFRNGKPSSGDECTAFLPSVHRMDIETAVRVVLMMCGRFREPETTRSAHRLLNECRRASGARRN
jgi:hypothetical protein